MMTSIIWMLLAMRGSVTPAFKSGPSGGHLDASQAERIWFVPLGRRLPATRDICFRDATAVRLYRNPIYIAPQRGCLNRSRASRYPSAAIGGFESGFRYIGSPRSLASQAPGSRVPPELGCCGEQETIAADQANAPYGMSGLRQPTRNQEHCDRQRRIAIEPCKGLSQFSSHDTCSTKPPRRSAGNQRVSFTADMTARS